MCEPPDSSEEIALLKAQLGSCQARYDAQKQLIRQLEYDRDYHRKSLNAIADWMRVVHEDEKILNAVAELNAKARAAIDEVSALTEQLDSIGQDHHNAVEALRLSRKHHEEDHAKLPDSAELQMLCLGLAEVTLRRPGFDYANEQLALKLGGEVAKSYYEAFKKTSADLVKPIP